MIPVERSAVAFWMLSLIGVIAFFNAFMALWAYYVVRSDALLPILLLFVSIGIMGISQGQLHAPQTWLPAQLLLILSRSFLAMAAFAAIVLFGIQISAYHRDVLSVRNILFFWEWFRNEQSE